MPTYEYACKACGHRLEAVQKFTDGALTVCPECGGALRKVFGAVGIVLKGSGFYKTDTRASDKRSGAEAAGSNGSNGSDGSDGSKSDTKTETKSDSGAKSDSTSKSDSGAKTDSAKPSTNGDRSPKESKPAASTAS